LVFIDSGFDWLNRGRFDAYSRVLDIALQILAWTILVVCTLAGLVFVFLPVIPGPLFIIIGVVIHKLMLPGWISWGMVGFLVFIAVLERVADLAGTLAGAKWMGATKWGLIGAAIGGIVGLVFGIIGIFIGPVIGAVVAEIIFAKRHPKESMRAGVGAGVGVGLATVARLALTMFMVVVVAYDMIFIGP
jgi:uncharacterized protein YqgC (DUF456 family)